MEILGGTELRRRMLESYARGPKGWSFVLSPSPASGYFDGTLSGPEGAWLLKVDSVFKPAPVVIGAQAEPLRRRPEGPIPYGYRTLPPELAVKIMGDGDLGEHTDTRKRLLSVLGSDPVVPERGGSYAEGPLMLTGPGRVSLSDAQKEIDGRLSSEMRRLLRLRYPAYG